MQRRATAKSLSDSPPLPSEHVQARRFVSLSSDKQQAHVVFDRTCSNEMKCELRAAAAARRFACHILFWNLALYVSLRLL